MLIKWVGGRSRPAFWKKDDCPWMLAIRRRSKGKPRKERSSRARRCLPRRREERTDSIRRLHPRHLEGIALIDIPGLDAGPEPVGPLFGGTVGERIGNDKAPGPLLQTVVPDGAGRAERLLHVARFQDIPRLVRVEGPDSAQPPPLGLQPDCLAGIWAFHANKARNILEAGDVEKALGAASAIGDDRLQKRARGFVVPDAFTHGTAEQRAHWFRAGIESGDINQCNTFKVAGMQ